MAFWKLLKILKHLLIFLIFSYFVDLCDRIPGRVARVAKLLLTVCFLGIMISSNISNIILTTQRLEELLELDDSILYVQVALFLLISIGIFKIEETEKISFVFYLNIVCLLFL